MLVQHDLISVRHGIKQHNLRQTVDCPARARLVALGAALRCANPFQSLLDATMKRLARQTNPVRLPRGIGVCELKTDALRIGTAYRRDPRSASNRKSLYYFEFTQVGPKLRH